MRTRLWLKLWVWSRAKALERVREERPDQYRDARRAWSQHAILYPPLDGPGWVTRGLPNDLALHDAADYLLGKQLD